MKRKALVFLTAALASLASLPATGLLAQSAGGVKIATPAELANPGPTGSQTLFSAIDSSEYVSIQQGSAPGIDLSDTFGTVYVVIEDNDPTANAYALISLEDVSAQANGANLAFTVAEPPIVDANRDGVLDPNDVQLFVDDDLSGNADGVVGPVRRFDIASVTPTQIILSAGPPAGTDVVTVTYRTSVIDQLVHPDTGASLVEIRGDSDSIWILARETDIDGIDGDASGGVEAAELAAAANADSGIFVGAFSMIPAEWKDLIVDWLGDDDATTTETEMSGVAGDTFTITLVDPLPVGYVFADANADGVLDERDITISAFADANTASGPTLADLDVVSFNPTTGEVVISEATELGDTITFRWRQSLPIADLQAAILAQTGAFDALDTDDTVGPSVDDESVDLDDLLTDVIANLGMVPGTDGALTFANRLLGVENGDDVDVRYTDRSPAATRVTSTEVDLTAPVVTAINPLDNSFRTSADFDGEFTVTDTGSGIVDDAHEEGFLQVLLTTPLVVNADITAEVDEEDDITNGFTYTVEIDVDDEADDAADDGDNLPVTLTIIATDGVGNTTTLEVDFTIDILEPELLGGLTGWTVEFNDEDDVWELVENDDEWLVLIFDAPIDGASVSPSDINIPGHSVQNILWISDPEGLSVDPLVDYDGANADDDITDDNGAGMDLTPDALNDPRHLLFVQVESGSFDTDETPDVDIDDGDLADLAGNPNSDELEIEARDRLWPAFIVDVTNPLSNSGLTATITVSEDLDGKPSVQLMVDFDGNGTFDETVSVRNSDIDATTNTRVWQIDVELNDLNPVRASNGSDDGVYVIVVTGVDAADNSGRNDDETWELDTLVNGNLDPETRPAPDGTTEIDEPVFIRVEFPDETAEYEDDSSNGVTITAATLEELDGEDGDVVNTTPLGTSSFQSSNNVLYVVALDGISQGFFNLLIEFQDAAGNEGDFELPFQVIAPVPAEIEVTPGWSLISFPGRPESTALDVVLADTTITQVWSFNSQTQVWQFARLNEDSGMWEGTLTQMTDGRAYYVRSSTFDPIEVLMQRFSPQRTPPQYPIMRGWNGIGYTPGGSEQAAPVANYLQSLASGFGDAGWGVLRWWDPVERRYESTWPTGAATAGFPTEVSTGIDANGDGDTLDTFPIVHAGQGYLLYATRNGTLAP